ncbi:MAG TPA: C40 family peptidase [Burkholderiales bacterium]|nr:C40 family peptidase [Burkholderiales bacterium]
MLLALAALYIAGCASTPTTRSRPAPRPVPIAKPAPAPSPAPDALPAPPAPVTLSPRAFDEIAAARTRELALHALAHVGVPYRYGGTSPESGFDCSGLVYYVFRNGLGLALPRNTQALSEVGEPVPTEALEPGDLVFFDTMRKPYSHVGIYLGDYRFIHAPTTGGRVELVDLRHQYWRTRFNGARRLSL